MATGVAAASMFFGRWRVYTPNVNWAEDFWLKATTVQDAVKILAEGVWWRTSWFGANVKIGNGSVSIPGLPRDRWGFPKAQLPAYGGYPWARRNLFNPYADALGVSESNDPFVGPFYEMGTVDGKWAERIIGGCPDGDIIGLRWIGEGDVDNPAQPPEVWGGAVPAPGNPGTPTLTARAMYLFWLQNSTVRAKQDGSAGPVVIGTTTFTTSNWDSCAFSRIGKRDRGGIKEFHGRRLSGS